VRLGDVFHRFEIDKQAHFFAGSTIAFAVGTISNLVVGYLVAIFLAGAKELYDDKSRTGTPDRKDFIVTIFGGTLATGWLIGIELYKYLK